MTDLGLRKFNPKSNDRFGFKKAGRKFYFEAVLIVIFEDMLLGLARGVGGQGH